MNHRFYFLAVLSGLTFTLITLLLTFGSASPVQAISLAPIPLAQAGTNVVTASTPTTITLVSSSNPSSVGQTVSFTATVHIPPASGAPTGSMQFKVDGSNLGAAVTLSECKASVSTSWSANGMHTISAVYSGDANFSPSASSMENQCIGLVGCDQSGSNQELSFTLSNEPPGYLIHKLIDAGFGSSSLYTVTLYLKTLPGADMILTNGFINALANSPAGSSIFTTPLSQYDFDAAVALNTDGTAQFVDVYGQDYYSKPNTTTLKTGNITLQKTNFTYSNDPQTPLTSWNKIVGLGAFHVTTTYKVFAVAWGDSYSLYLPVLVR
jgi:hypothetical protein